MSISNLLNSNREVAWKALTVERLDVNNLIVNDSAQLSGISGVNLNDLDDVSAPTPNDNDVLKFDFAQQLWEAQPDSGEVNTASNVGGGSGVFKQKTAEDLEFKSVIGGTNIDIVNNVDDLTLNLNPIISSGTYTPVASSFVSITSITGLAGFFHRMGNVVTVSFRADIDPMGVTESSFRLSLPIARTSGNFASANDAAGNGTYRNFTTLNSRVITVTPVTGTELVLVEFRVMSTSTVSISGASFSYEL